MTLTQGEKATLLVGSLYALILSAYTWSDAFEFVIAIAISAVALIFFAFVAFAICLPVALTVAGWVHQIRTGSAPKGESIEAARRDGRLL